MAIRKSETKRIGEFDYRMERMGGVSGRAVAWRLAPAFAAFVEGLTKSGVSGVGPSELAAGTRAALLSLSEDDLNFVCDALARATTVTLIDEGKPRQWPLPTVFDDHFEGRYDDMLAWLRWGIELNRFFGSALERFAAVVGKASTSASPTASTGGPGDSSSATG